MQKPVPSHEMTVSVVGNQLVFYVYSADAATRLIDEASEFGVFFEPHKGERRYSLFVDPVYKPDEITAYLAREIGLILP